MKTFERSCGIRRQPGCIWEADKQGNYTVPVFDPLASVIGYLRDRKYLALHQANIDNNYVSAVNDAIEICVANY